MGQTLKTGTHDVSSTLAARLSTVPNFNSQNLEKIRALIDDEQAAFNTQADQMVADLATPTTDKVVVTGNIAGGSGVEVDEYGRAPTQKEVPGETLGIPLRKFQYPIGWTTRWFEIKSPIDLAIAVAAAQTWHLKRLKYEIQRALLLSANYTFYDHLVDNQTLAVKRLINADSSTIGTGPNGESYDGATHTHYNGFASLTAANMTTNINDVVEHGLGTDVRAYISLTDETAVRALTGFVPYTDPRLIIGFPSTGTFSPTRLDITRLDNRAIGIFGAAEVWVKPWIPASYQFAFSMSGPKPLSYRQEAGALAGLRVEGENPAHPLLARFFAALYGFAVTNRLNGAVGYFANATFADPTLVEP